MKIISVKSLTPVRLDKYLTEQFPALTFGRLNKALRENKIKLNGKKNPFPPGFRPETKSGCFCRRSSSIRQLFRALHFCVPDSLQSRFMRTNTFFWWISPPACP